MDSRPRLLLRSIFGDHGRVPTCAARRIIVGSASMAKIIKRSVLIAGHRTSVSLEEGFWWALKEIAGREGISVAKLINRIDSTRGDENLASTLRMFVLEDTRERTMEGLMTVGNRPGQKTGCDPQ
jgi:predicted DNA-binding ribbon-helix-helix protein